MELISLTKFSSTLDNSASAKYILPEGFSHEEYIKLH